MLPDPEKLKQLQIQPQAKERSRLPFVLIVLAVVLATGAAIYFAIPRESDQQRLKADSPQPLASNVKSSSADESSATNSPAASPALNHSILTVSGYIINRERIELSPRFMGVVKWIGVKKGDAVTNGQVVVLLDDAELQARLAEAEAAVTNAMIAVAKARLDFDRIQKLNETKLETQQAEDHARLQLAGARASLQQAEAGRELARTYVDWTVIRAPINGVVLEKLVDPNELVTPQSFGGTRGPSTALIALADPKDLQVEIDLNEADVAKVFIGQKCKVSPEAYSEKSYDGVVAEMAPEANRQKGTLQVKVQILNPDKFLTPELTAKVDFLK